MKIEESGGKKGYALKMMELLFAKLKEDGAFEITDAVSKRNEPSIQFHLKCGFEIYKDPAVCVLNGCLNFYNSKFWPLLA